MAKKIKSTQTCIKCGEPKQLEDFYISYSPLHMSGRCPLCKECISKYDANNLTEVISVLRTIDRPYYKELWDKAILTGKDNIFGKYMRILALNHKDKVFADGDNDETKTITRMNTEIMRKQMELEQLEEKAKSVQKEEENKIPDDLILKWGRGYTSDEYMMFEEKYKLIESSYPLRSTMHLEALKTYVRYAVKAELATANNDIASAKEWGKLANEASKKAKIDPSQLSQQDLTAGLDSFSELVRQVEKAVDIIPILPQFIEKPKDKVDFTVLCYVNYERHLKGLPMVEYKDIYDFYNKMVKDYLDASPTDYAFLNEMDTDLPLVNRVYQYVFTIVIPKAKKEHPNDPFYQHLEKWVELVSYFRWFPDLFYDLITPIDGGGIRLDLDQRVLLRVMARFKRVYAVFPRGYAKCVSYDTMLFTNDGIKEIGELFDYKKTHDEEIITTHDFAMLNRYGKLETSDKGIISGYKETKKIKTEYGYEIETSLVHPLLIMDKNGELVYKKANELEKGDYLPVNRKNDVWGNKTTLDIDMQSYIDGLSNQTKHQVLRGKCNTPNVLTEELSLILGYLVGDGTVTRDNIIIFSSKDDDMISRYSSFMNNIGLDVTKRDKSVDYVTYGKYHREYFRQIGLNKVDAFEKEIPKCILSAPKKMVSAFMRGLFDTDGCVDKGYITFCTASEKLSKQVQTVLLNFGIICKREKTFNKRYNTYAYRLFIYGHNVELYMREIGFSCARKQEKLINICNVKRNTNKDIIPYQKDTIIKLYEKSKGKNTYKFGDDLYHVRKGNNELTYDKLSKVFSTYELEECEEYSKLNELKELYYFYTPIVEIEDGEDYVCDIQMSETHSFIGNGFVNHNTFLQTLFGFHTSIFYPDNTIALTAQTLQNASSLVKDKFSEIMRFYPMLKKETYEKQNRFADNLSEVYWKSGAKIDTLANAQSSKGQRRKRIVVEEACQMSDTVFADCIEPICNIPRRSIGKLAIVNPLELNGQINFFTTSWYRGCVEFERNISMMNEMAELKGVFALGSDFELACSYGRGEPKSAILEKKERLNPTAFAMNYMSHWVGSSESQLIAINKVMDIRNVTKAELKWDGKHDHSYILGVDVARSENKENNQSSVVVLKLIKNKNGKLVNVICVNIINYPSTVNFQTLAINLMKLKALYNAKAVVVDANGLGEKLPLIVVTLCRKFGEPRNLGCVA